LLDLHKVKAPLASWCDDAGVSRLRHSDYGRIIFCGYVRIRTTPARPSSDSDNPRAFAVFRLMDQLDRGALDDRRKTFH
jgi:hypothetical protein